MMIYTIRKILFLVVVVAAIGGVVYGVSKIDVGPKVVMTLDGVEVGSFDEISQTQFLIWIEWTISCPYCMDQIDYVKSLNLPSDKVTVVLANVGDSKSAVKRWADKNNLPSSWVILVHLKPSSSGTPYTRIMIRTEAGWQVADQWVGFDPNMFAPLIVVLEEL